MEYLDKIESKKIFTALTIIFIVFYAAQISFWSSRADVLTFASRSLSKAPITGYAYLTPKSLLGDPLLPNYHLGHTVVLWLVYKLFPGSLAKSIWPAGLVSAISGGFVIGLTFLIWVKLGINKYKSLIIAVFAGIIPSIWFHNTFGEIYSLQLLSILLFLYFFYNNNLILSILAFTFANLVSPLSALSFSFILLSDWNKKTFKNAFIVGAVSLIIYSIIYILIGSNLLNMVNPLSSEQEGRSFLYRLIMLILFIILNFNFFIFYLIKGFKKSLKDEPGLFKKLLIATSPQLLLLFLGSTFFIELGSFQLPLFWALAFPVGLILSEIKLYEAKVWLPLIGSVLLVIFLWQIPDRTIAAERHDAGEYLKSVGLNHTKIIGDWGSSVGIILTRDNWEFNSLCNHYYDRPFPSQTDINETGEDSLIIVAGKKQSLRKLMSKLPLKGLELHPYNPFVKIKEGRIQKIFENDSVTLYSWKKSGYFHHNEKAITK